MDHQPYILVVDDDVSIRTLIVDVLEDDGYAVRAASSGLEALDLCDTGAPQLVVLDLKMPGMDGRSLFSQLRGRHIEAPVIIVSAAGAQSAMRELGAEDWLAKPFDINVLSTRVAALLQS